MTRLGLLGRFGLALSLFGIAPSTARAAANGLEICFAPGTPDDEVQRAYSRLSDPPTSLQRFRLSGRWSQTATNGVIPPPTQGKRTTLTWSVVPDGTPLPSGFGEPPTASNFQARMNAIYPGGPSVWRPLIAQVLARWGQLAGITYVAQTTDDGASMPSSPGVLNVRGDVRIGGHSIDGASNVLAYNYFPDSGDMVIDTDDMIDHPTNPGFFINTSNNSIRLRNTLSHEHGHGMGLNHVCPTNGTKLMEPFINVGFDGPQLDDILGGQRHYGDAREENDTAGTATLVTGGSFGDLSNDNNTESDVYRIVLPGGQALGASMVAPTGSYLEGPQNANGSCTAGTSFNPQTVNDFGIQLLGSDGTTVLATANGNPVGVTETIPTVPRPAGTYYLRTLTGTTNNVQAYTLNVSVVNASRTLAISDATILEGNAGTANVTFTVSLSAPAVQATSVVATTADQTAVSGADYVATSSAVSFAIGESSKPFAVPVTGDLLDENDETFVVNLSSPIGATIADGQGVGTIQDNDAPPSISVNDVATLEGSTGNPEATFTVSLSGPSGLDVTVQYATADGSAIAGSDYAATSGSLSFTAGQVTKSVPVPLVPDLLDEDDETFTLNLSSAVNATIADPQGEATIQDDDAPPNLSIGDAGLVEGNTGASTMTFVASLDRASSRTITATFNTADGSAIAPGDYAAAGGSLTFLPGQTVATVDVTISGDVAVEPDESLTVNLSNATNVGAIDDPQGVGTIVNDDGGLNVELTHGYKERTTLEAQAGVANTDLYRIFQAPWASYEVVVDETSGDVVPLALERVDTGGSVIQTGQPGGTGGSVHLRWSNGGGVVTSEQIRVRSGGCTTTCGADDTYRLRLYETTASIPRFNNSGSQVTVLILQNPGEGTIAGTVRYWSPAGTLLGSSPFSIAAHNTMVLNTTTVVPSASGSITVTHDGGFAALSGKAVALEPATGFSFDSPIVTRQR